MMDAAPDSSPPKPFVLERVTSLEWYDGPVTAVVREASTGPWLCFLLSARRPRISGLTRTTAEHADAIEAMCTSAPSGPWQRLVRRFHVALAESTGPLVLLRGPVLRPGEPLEQTAIDWEAYRGRVTFSGEDAFEPGRVDLWTEVFECALEDDRVRDRFRQWAEANGFGLRSLGGSFPDGQLMVHLPPDAPGVVSAWVGVEVGVETDGKSWQLQVTEHGGRTWVRAVSSEEEARRVAEAYLRSPTRPPGAGWRETQ